jgi:hypothetical protein
MTKKPILICTFVVILSGAFGSYIGGQIALIVRSQKCQNQPWGFKEVCTAWVTPGALWEGGTTGLWTGTVLGAVIGGLVTRQPEG